MPPPSRDSHCMPLIPRCCRFVFFCSPGFFPGPLTGPIRNVPKMCVKCRGSSEIRGSTPIRGVGGLNNRGVRGGEERFNYVSGGPSSIRGVRSRDGRDRRQYGSGDVPRYGDRPRYGRGVVIDTGRSSSIRGRSSSIRGVGLDTAGVILDTTQKTFDENKNV